MYGSHEIEFEEPENSPQGRPPRSPGQVILQRRLASSGQCYEYGIEPCRTVENILHSPHPVWQVLRHSSRYSSVFQEHLRYALTRRRAVRRESCTGSLHDLCKAIAARLSVQLRERFLLARIECLSKDELLC